MCIYISIWEGFAHDGHFGLINRSRISAFDAEECVHIATTLWERGLLIESCANASNLVSRNCLLRGIQYSD